MAEAAVGGISKKRSKRGSGENIHNTHALNDEDDIIDEASAFSAAAAVAAAVASSASAVAASSSSNSNNTKMLTRTQSISIDTELANEVFDHFMSQAATLKSILRTFRYLCDILRLKPQEWPHFYPKLKSKLTSWKANALWAKFDKRASHKVYMKGKACAGQRVLVIGAGPCGLRTAIECQLLGAKVVVLEKRDRYSRNNVLHLWPCNIHDLRGLGAKKFYGKFCAGSIDHISIRALQCILLKVALLMGVEIYESCSFEDLIEPEDIETGWRAKIIPEDHPVNQFEFDVLIGADGKRNTLKGFKRKEFRGKLAIAITANFINKHTEAESRIEEISGVAFIFNQKFFNDLNEAKGVDLENIVYYKDATHYFVMTAKKQSLIDKGVISENYADTANLLSADNINQEKLFEYAREAADYATNYQMPHLDFAVNHYGKPDVAMFDFTSMYQAENSCRVTERHGHRLLTCLVGDSLLEPFWPTGTGCPRGFIGGFDACWLIRTLALGKVSLLEAIAERESIYRLLAQTTPENTSKDFASYTVDPKTRYVTLNTKLLSPHQVPHLVDTDNPSQLQEDLNRNTYNAGRKRKESTVSPDALLVWLAKQVESYDKVIISDMTTSFQNGLALCAIIHRYRPDLIDFHTLDAKDSLDNLQFAFDLLEHELGISPVIKATELADVTKVPDKLTMMSYLSQVYDCFRREIPNVQQSMEGIPEEPIQDSYMVAKKAAKKRKSKEHHNNTSSSLHQQHNDTKEEVETMFKDGESHNKENVHETVRMNRSANRKRLLNLMQRAEASANEKKKAAMVKSVKDQERYKVIEKLATGKDHSKRRSGDNVAKYRENKKPKELKRAIGKIDKEDWNIKNIEEKLVINTQTPDVKKDKVPKWSKAAFQDKFNIMKGKLESSEEGQNRSSITAIDAGLAKLQKKLREGSTMETGERGSNRVSALAEELFASRKADTTDDNSNTSKSVEPAAPPKKKSSFGSSSENCYFCKKRVYVVERMSAEGKFFHRSCFRCDYCHILLRLGSYVYHRDNTPFSGRFFCIPHSTENALEKYRYRKKADEIKDAENRKHALFHVTNQEWSSPSYIQHHRNRLQDPSSGSGRNRGATPERAEYEASIDQDSEPPSIMDEDEWTDRNFGGNSLVMIEEDNNTSEDSATSLDSDEDDPDDEDSKKPLSAKEARQLQREWLKRIQNGDDDEEISHYDNVKGHSSSDDEEDDDDDDDDDCDEDDREADYEDSEYESVSSDSELDEGCSNIKLTVPLHPTGRRSRKKVCPHGKRQLSSTEEHEEESDSDSSDDLESEQSEDEESEEESLDEFSGSESNSECEFTDSEGKPNPFHKELEVPSILIQPGSPAELPGMRRYPEDIIEAKVPTSILTNQPNRYQYKTPNYDSELAKKEKSSTSSNYVGRSTQRAFNLKKHWAMSADQQPKQQQINSMSTNNITTTNNTVKSYNTAKNNDANLITKKSVEKSEIDNRLKSLMDRLSNQQKLLKPADKPSTEMEHFMKRSTNNTSNTSSSGGLKSTNSTDKLMQSDLKSPILLNRQTSETSGLKFSYTNPQITPYYQQNDSITTTSGTTNGTTEYCSSGDVPVKSEYEKLFRRTESVPNNYQSHTNGLHNHKNNKEHEEEQKTNEKEEKIPEFRDVETIEVPHIEDHHQKPEDLVEESLEEDDSEDCCDPEDEISEQPEKEVEKAPPIPPIPDIYVEEHQKSSSAGEDTTIPKIIEENNTNNHDTTYESCPNNLSNETTNEDLDDSAYMTPANELSLNPEHLKDSDIPLADDDDDDVVDENNFRENDFTKNSDGGIPFITSTPSQQDELIRSPTESEKSFIQKQSEHKLTDDEIMRIYQERNPLERLAKFNSLKRKQSSVVHDMIIGRNSSSNKPPRAARRTRVAVPSSSIPPIPTTAEQEATSGNGSSTAITTTPIRRPRAATEPPMLASLPATPLTDPAKFGIPPSRPARNTTKKPENNNKNQTPSSSPPKKKEIVTTTTNNSSSADITNTNAASSITKQKSDQNIDKLDGIISSAEDNSHPNSPAKKADKNKKTLMQTISGIFRGTSNTRMASPEHDISLTSPSSTSEHRKSRSSEFMKFLQGAGSGGNKNNSSKSKSPVSSPEMAPRANLSEVSDDFSVNSNNQQQQQNNQNLKMIFKPSHPSTPPVPLSRKITITRNASEESLSDGIANESAEDLNNSTSGENSLNIIPNGQGVPPEIMEKIMKRGNKSNKRASKVAHLKRVRKAQEIQRQLEELDVIHRDLEERGIEAEKSIRDDPHEDPDLLQTWFVLLAEKNALVRHEQELLVQAKQLELEDKSGKLEAELRDHLLLDSRSTESVSREASILQELLSIAEQRELLQNMLERDQRRYQKEDQDIEAQMKAKGLRVITPVHKLSFARLTTSSTA